MISGKVVRIADGDTLTILLEKEKLQQKIRLFGIDAPESHQDFGQKSKQYLSRMVFGKAVQIDCRGKDRYGRVLGYVLYGGKNINLEMVRSGMAWHYIDYAKNERNLAEAEKQARKERLGLWGQGNPVPPWQFRKDQKNGKKSVR